MVSWIPIEYKYLETLIRLPIFLTKTNIFQTSVWSIDCIPASNINMGQNESCIYGNVSVTLLSLENLEEDYPHWIKVMIKWLDLTT